MYSVFEKLLKSRGITVYKFCKETGVSESTIYTWKKKDSRCGAKLAEIISNYFGVSIDFLMTGKESEVAEEGHYLNPETAKMAQEIFENKELRALFSASRNASPEDLKIAHDMILALKRRENGSID